MSTQVTLIWDNDAFSATGIEIRRSVSDSEYTVIGSIGPEATQFIYQEEDIDLSSLIYSVVPYTDVYVNRLYGEASTVNTLT